MALRTMVTKLKQKIPAAIQRVIASSRAPALSSSPRAGLDRLDPEIRQAVKELVNLHRKNQRDEALARCAGFGWSCSDHLVTWDPSTRKLKGRSNK